ncbi:quercetin 2,3-dioxygenase [Kitasatospora viridis]|uniref:Quercetin dioxygenase-like cupin family protein n=1 Tax=Kitasatospora viridis TaxID=281105 RepID=A0A561UCG4_9ACTN|nr:quercetin 2,3-dioxygenase [Kitasatospora viridis]TWF97053.1 quercetin dioxygenase-like cupin family protein [Kitasatospora viridis]
MSIPYHLAAGKDQALWHMGALLKFKLTGKETGGQFWLAEQTSDQGYASPLHRHTREDETFVVLDGELRVQVGDEVFEAEPGSVTFAPRELAHTFQVVSPSARFLILTTPAGFEQWFFETGGPAQSLTVPPPVTEVPDIGRLIGSLAAHGVDLVGPPPGMGAPPLGG